MNRKRVLGVLLSLILVCITLHPTVLSAISIKDTTYYVQFNSNGGSYVAPIYKVLYGDTIEIPANPTRYGYWFRGWYSDAALTTKFDQSTQVRSNIILYAKWEKKSSTPNIMSQNISDNTDSSTVTIDITGQTFGSGCQMNLITYPKSDLKTVVYTVNKTTKYIGFELNIDDFVFDTSKPIPVKIKIPSRFNAGCTQVVYTTDMETVAGIPEGYVNTSGEYVFDAYYSGTYILMEGTDQTNTITTSNAYLSISMASALKVDTQYSGIYKLMNYPGDESNFTFKWYSSKPYVAHITKDGIVTAKRPGITVISCASTDGTIVARKTLTVYKRKITSLSTNVTIKQVKKGKSFTIKVAVTPSTASNKTVSFTSSNTKIATVSAAGKVTGKKRGTCHVVVRSTDGSNKKKTIKIVVV